jgi:hypothetical protein
MSDEQQSLPLGEQAQQDSTVNLPRPTTLTTICTISCGMSARHFFSLLAAEQVSMLVDTRMSREYRDAKFAFGDDLAFMCERLDVGYLHLTSLAPTKELRSDLHAVLQNRAATQGDRAVAWTVFLKGYYDLMVRRKILLEGAPLRELIYGPHTKIAVMCACQHHMDCHRRVLAGIVSCFVDGVGLSHLSPHAVGGPEPRLKSPRRYLLEDLPRAGITANPTRGRKS